MKTAAEIAKEILYFPVTNGQDKTSIEAGAKLIEAYAASFKPKWVKVEDQLPEIVDKRDSKLLFVLTEWHGIYVPHLAKYDSFAGSFIETTNSGSFRLPNVTHWQPLPEKPTK